MINEIYLQTCKLNLLGFTIWNSMVVRSKDAGSENLLVSFLMNCLR